jgi:hypothetical protein
MENALEKRSDVVRAIYKVNRFVQNCENPELAREIASVTEWVSNTHAHNHGDVPTPAVVSSTVATAVPPQHS